MRLLGRRQSPCSSFRRRACSVVVPRRPSCAKPEQVKEPPAKVCWHRTARQPASAGCRGFASQRDEEGTSGCSQGTSVPLGRFIQRRTTLPLGSHFPHRGEASPASIYRRSARRRRKHGRHRAIAAANRTAPQEAPVHGLSYSPHYPSDRASHRCNQRSTNTGSGQPNRIHKAAARPCRGVMDLSTRRLPRTLGAGRRALPPQPARPPANGSRRRE